MYKKLFLFVSIICLPFSAMGFPFVANWSNWNNLAKGVGALVTAAIATQKLYNDTKYGQINPSDPLSPPTPDYFNLTQLLAPSIIASSAAMGAYLIYNAAKNLPVNNANTAIQLAKIAGGSLIINFGRLAGQALYKTDKEVTPKIILGGGMALCGLVGGYLGYHGIKELIK